ncbi:MAG: gamma-glutamyltransferase, partial [Sphingomonas sp.]|nr:gamma-glutamyltransferase [Sphingomonas sp.]
MKTSLIALTALLLAPAPALAHPAKAQPAARGVVSAADPRAAEAGREILRKGGTAADAEMAMMLALTVVEPQSSGIGGGGFFVYQQAGGKLVTIDGREKTPAAATPKRFLTPDGKPMPFFQAVPGGLSVGVPGNIRLMAMVHQRFGKLPWNALFAPAIKLAEEGYTVTKPMAAGMGYVSQIWSAFPAISAQYTRDGKPLTEGALVKNPDLAKTLRLIADKGPDAFYTGATAQAIVTAATTAQRNPSDMTLADLAAYQAKERPPICGSYRGYKICGMGPPSSGAVTVLQVLGMLERFDMKKLGASNPVSWHLIGEAMLLAYADREKYLADSDFVSIPLKGMTDKAYLKSRSMLLSPDKALGTYEAG